MEVYVLSPVDNSEELTLLHGVYKTSDAAIAYLAKSFDRVTVKKQITDSVKYQGGSVDSMTEPKTVWECYIIDNACFGFHAVRARIEKRELISDALRKTG